jgi:signal recognition particle receptor subunit beta
MVQINFAKREVQCKVVYYGPSMSGKTANLRQIHDRSPEKVRGALTTISTDTERTLFFDFLPLNLGLIANVRAKINLYAVPYNEENNSLRLLVLEGVDGIVFVADSGPNRIRANLAALENLHENVARLGRDPNEIPLVFQWNKRDLKTAVEVQELAHALNPHGRPAFEAAAEMGAGVFQALKAVTNAVLVNVTRMIVAPAAPEGEDAPAEAPRGRIRAVATRDVGAAEPEPAFEMPEREPEPEPVLAAHAERVRSFEPATAAGSRLSFDDVALPTAAAEPEPEPPEQPAHETPVTPPWRRAPDRPAIRSQQQEFADHLSTDSFSSHPAPAPVSEDPHATSGLPQRDVPRSADRHVEGRGARGRRLVETETALEPAAAADPSAWGDYTDPKSVDLQAEVPGDWEQPATGAVRVRGRTSGWETERRPRDPRPVVDRRKRTRRENVEVLPARSLWAGSLFSLFLLGVIGYLVHALL